MHVGLCLSLLASGASTMAVLSSPDTPLLNIRAVHLPPGGEVLNPVGTFGFGIGEDLVLVVGVRSCLCVSTSTPAAVAAVA